jgi:phosphoglycerate dehydrogenase-like enzyme
MEQLAQHIDAIMSYVYIPPEVIESARNLKLVVWLHTGCDQLDLRALRSRNVQVSNVRGAHAVVVAEQAFAFILALSKKLLRNHQAVVEGEYLATMDPAYASIELAGKTLAIVGLGNLGEQIAKRAKAFEMRVLGVDPNLRTENADQVFPPEDIREVLSQTDFVVLAVPLTPRTRRMIGEEELKAMPSSAYLINVCRGEVVHEGSIARALEENWIAGFASDVWWDYPDGMPPSYHYPVPSRLGVHRMPQVVASGDRASNVLALKKRILEMGAESLGAFFRGEAPPRLIDLELGY